MSHVSLSRFAGPSCEVGSELLAGEFRAPRCHRPGACSFLLTSGVSRLSPSTCNSPYRLLTTGVRLARRPAGGRSAAGALLKG